MTDLTEELDTELDDMLPDRDVLQNLRRSIVELDDPAFVEERIVAMARFTIGTEIYLNDCLAAVQDLKEVFLQVAANPEDEAAREQFLGLMGQLAVEMGTHH